MSFGSSGFGGFGQQNTTNTNQPSAFGGFGSTNNANNTPAFGSTNTNTFGNTNTNTTGGGLFGSTGGTGFGASTGGFGQTNSAFGAKPAFGTATTTGGGGLFGSTTTSAVNTGFGGGGFGTTNTANTTPFGGGSSLFGGANKPSTTFGSTTTPAAGTSLFGGASGGFGSTTTGAFGATNNPGLGANIGDSPGTAQIQFTPTVEKEASNPTQSNSFQNVLFMEPYKKWSSEELRLADYNQGRRHGNGTGVGAFGVSSGFGNTGFAATPAQNTGFGSNTGTGLFGSSQPTNTGFGGTTSNTGGFGTTTSGTSGLFGANKPATTGLFGNTQAAPSGGLFGNSATNTGFGTTANTGSTFGTNTGTSTGLFGAKPAQSTGGFFGNQNTAANTATTGAFGANSSAINSGTGLFGQPTQNAAAGSGLFGNPASQNTTGGFGGNSGFGAQTQNAGSSLFGNQNKPSGLFGNSGTATTGGSGLFGQNNSTPFGQSTNTQAQGGGLFGAAKPAGTGTGLFGQATTGQTGNTGTGLFGSLGTNTQTQQPAQTSLFGNLQNQAAKSSLFTNTASTGGGGLFGNQNTQQPSGLFGNTMQQQQQQPSAFGGSMFGNPQNQQAPQSLSASINDISAYGAATLFSNLSNGDTLNPGPLATPLSGGKNKLKSRSILPVYKLSPANAARFVTPQKRGFGFSYSTYGSPGSASSVSSTPGGLGQSLLMGSIGRGLSKSISTSNLRRSFNVEDSILSPGAFSASSGPRFQSSSGSHKKLIINRDMRSDLFSSPNKDKPREDATNGSRKLTKRVSFDTSTVPAIENGSQDSKAPSPNGSGSTAQDLGLLRPSSRQNASSNGTKSSPTPATPEMEQVKGNELAIVHEEEPAPPAVKEPDVNGDTEPGAYWMSPTKEDILDMNRMQRQKVVDFTVGRENVGSVRFKVPVDLSSIDLDQLFSNIVVLEPRSATVYPIMAKKPPMGKGLNVPAQISLEQSWPRARDKRTPLLDKSGSRFNKHIERLKRIENTTFEGYDRDTGVWTFSVEHFTTYGLEYDEDDDTEARSIAEVSTLQEPQTQTTAVAVVPSPEIDPDDTFDFRRNRRAVPGAFDGTAYSDDEEMAESDHAQSPKSLESDDSEIFEHALSSRRVGAVPDTQEPQIQSFDGAFDTMAVASPSVEPWAMHDLQDKGNQGTDQLIDEEDGLQLARSGVEDQFVPAGILRARMRALKKSTAPTRIQVTGGDDWSEVLQQSVRAPRRVNRAELRALNESGAAWDLEDGGSSAPEQPRNVPDMAGFATSLDLMKSLFDKGPSQPAHTSPAKGFVKWPYEKQSKVTQDEEGLEDAFRNSTHITWGLRDTIVTASNSDLAQGRITLQSADFKALPEATNLESQIKASSINTVNGVPTAHLDASISIKSLSDENDILWKLASVLFDDEGADLPLIWQHLVHEATDASVARASTPEEKAIACLAGNRVVDACKHLVDSKNFRLATLVATIGSSEQVKKDIRAQIKDWQESNVLSDFSEPIRALYELLAGNAGSCAGLKAAPIENRISSFTISKRFGLDWMQSFGLRLWYSASRNISEAVRSFQSDIDQDREPEPNSPLWVLLKLYADRRVDYSSYSLDWQLTRALFSTGKVSFGQKAAQQLDSMTTSFYSQLTAAGHWISATFVLLHLTSPVSRAKAIRDHLGRHAHLIRAEEQSDSNFSTLTNQFKIPAKWVWEAKALYARSVSKDPVAEFSYLIKAQDLVEANRTFLRRVAPQAVIERRYDELFELAAMLYQVRDQLPDWSGGAGVYLLFPATRNWDASTRLPDWMDELVQGLAALRTQSVDVVEVAAIADMSEELVRLGERVHRRGGDPRLYKLAASTLPLTEDRRQKYLRDLVFEGMAQVGVH